MNPTSIPEQPIRFWFRGRIVAVDDAETTRTVLDWLREDARCTGTKEGCNEGDCGACTVVVAETADDQPSGLTLAAVNACIRFLPTLHGKALFTVEDLKTLAGGQLHPVQQAMVEQHASQCGFCTPGFVMSLWAAYERHQVAATRPDRQQLADALAGNLCRCTGYRPILAAGLAMFDAPPVLLERAPVRAALDGLARSRNGQPFHYRRAGATATSPTTPASQPTAPPEPAAPSPSSFYAPTTVADLAALVAAKPDARLLAGATDIALWVNKQFRPLGDLIHVGDVADLRRITIEAAQEGARGSVHPAAHEPVARELVIGARASLEAAWSALQQHYPDLLDVWLRFAGPPVRHAGTLGGNVANGSPIGDGPPVLLALDARLVLRRGGERRELPLADFYRDYMKNALARGEFLEAIRVPLAANLTVRAWKISKRHDSDISALLGAFALRLDAAGRVTHVRLAFGGMAAIAKRATFAEAALLGEPWAPAAVTAAQAALARDFTPISDLRASAGHRLRVAGNLLERFWLETRPDAPLPATATRVMLKAAPEPDHGRPGLGGQAG